jgi:transketolase N-terminal domain/subunit
MKTLIASLALISLTGAIRADELDNYKKDTEAIWRTGTGSEDGTYTAISTSMLGWGVGLSAGIAILASILHQSTTSHAHNSSSD